MTVSTTDSHLDASVKLPSGSEFALDLDLFAKYALNATLAACADLALTPGCPPRQDPDHTASAGDLCDESGGAPGQGRNRDFHVAES